jgi:hypothetical protein
LKGAGGDGLVRAHRQILWPFIPQLHIGNDHEITRQGVIRVYDAARFLGVVRIIPIRQSQAFPRVVDLQVHRAPPQPERGRTTEGSVFVSIGSGREIAMLVSGPALSGRVCSEGSPPVPVLPMFGASPGAPDINCPVI